jgi:hypothetical protein
LGRPEVFQGIQEVEPQLLRGVGASVGQSILGLGPNAFIGIEFRGVSRKGFEVQPFEAAAEGADRLAFVDAGVVPDDQDRSAQMSEEMTEKGADLGMPDIPVVQAIVQTEATALGADRKRGEDGDAVA